MADPSGSKFGDPADQSAIFIVESADFLDSFVEQVAFLVAEGVANAAGDAAVVERVLILALGALHDVCDFLRAALGVRALHEVFEVEPVRPGRFALHELFAGADLSRCTGVHVIDGLIFAALC